MKKCIKCKQEKELALFSKCPKSVAGRRNTCKTCSSEFCNNYNKAKRLQKKLENEMYYE